MTSKRIKMLAQEDFQIFAKNIRLSAQEDIKQVAGRCFGSYAVQDMTIGTQSNLHAGARGSVQMGPERTCR